MAGFLGMRGTGDWVTDERPKSWRESVLYLYPNGDAPLTAILSKMKSKRTTDAEFNWWTKTLPTQRGTVVDVYTDVALSSSYATGGADGDILYVNMSAAHLLHFRIGHQVLLRNSDNYADDCNAKVVDRTSSGSDSYVAVKLLEDDPTTTGLADCDTILVVGSINSEGAAMPEAISYGPTKHYNYTQISRTPLSITRTARLTNLRTYDQYKEAKREALELHSIELEKSLIFGVKSEGTGSNGKPERTTEGMIKFITNNSGVTSDFTSDTDYTDTAWVDGGEDWLDEQLEQIFRYGSDERLGFCGSGVFLAINKLIKLYGNYEFNERTKAYGIRVVEWHTPFGMIYLKRHPLFSYEETNRKSMLLFDPSDLHQRHITDTTFYGEGEKQNTGRGRIDGTDEEYLTEMGLEFHHPIKCGYFNGFGDDNGTP